jgi:hypothetical protein
MMRTRLTWVIVGGVVAVIVFAGLDALLSDHDPTTPRLTATTVSEATAARLRDCTPGQIALSIEIIEGEGFAAVVVQNVGDACFQRPLAFRLTIEDRAGNLIGEWGREAPFFGGDYAAGAAQTFSLAAVGTCDHPGPYVAVTTLGPHSARRANLSRSEIGC